MNMRSYKKRKEIGRIFDSVRIF